MRIRDLLSDFHTADGRGTLLYRFHVVLVVINLFAVAIDTGRAQFQNVWIEAAAAALLALNARQLRHGAEPKTTAYRFLAILAAALFSLIYLNHFATMSVVFVLLLPLATMPFLRLRESLLIEAAMVIAMALLLYAESRFNPGNPLVQNPQALFHLAYAALIIYVFGLLYHLSIVKTFDELDASNHQKELLLKEVHHRVKNNLNVIASIVGLQANSLSGEEKEHLEKTRIRIESIAMVHEMLYKSEDLSGVDFAAYMRKLSELLLGMFARECDIRVEIASAPEPLPLETMIQLGIMVNELMTNSVKYAFGKEGGVISLSLWCGDGECVFTYSDDGRGVDDLEALQRYNGLGVRLVRLTARQLGGDVEITSPKGLRYEVRFPRQR